MVPAHLYATGVAVYPALLFYSGILRCQHVIATDTNVKVYILYETKYVMIKLFQF